MLESLTQEQEALLDVVAEETIRAVLHAPPTEPDPAVVRRWLEVVYRLYDLPVPSRVEIVASPEAAFALERELVGETSRELDWCGAADAGWVSFYDYFARVGVLTTADPELSDVLALRDFQRGAWDTVLLDECAIVIQRPVVRTDDAGNLHCADGPAVRWLDGTGDYAWHGVWVPERVILDPRSYTREEYLAITDTEERRALGEAAGWDHVVSLLGATTLDTWIDPTTGLSYELIGTDSERWLRKQSPALQDGRQPYYVEPVHEDLCTARAARKWQATTWDPADCERDPTLTYRTET